MMKEHSTLNSAFNRCFSACIQKCTQKKAIWLLGFLFINSTLSFAQNHDLQDSQGTINGLITDNNNQGISHVYILESGEFSTITNFKGEFSLNLNPGKHKISLSHLQFKNQTKEISINQGETKQLKITLDEAEFNMDEVTVTGSASSMEIKNLPSSISIIKKNSPEFQSISSVDDVLARIPGVYVDRSRGLATSGSLTQVSLRGTGAANRTLIMKDGIPLNNSYTGSVTEWTTIASNGISRIEVVRGAASSLYGSNAMGGVINIVTENPKEQPVVAASAEYGSMNTTIADFKAGKTFKNGLGVMLISQYKNTDGYEYMNDSLWQDHYHAPSNEAINVTTKLNYHLNKSGLLEFIADFHREDSRTGTSTEYDGLKTRGNFLFRYKKMNPKLGYNLTAYTNRAKSEMNSAKYNEEDNAFSQKYYSSELPYNETGFVGKINSRIGKNNLTIGADIRYYHMESDYEYFGSGINQYQGEQIFYSAFFNDEVTINKMIDLSLGIRYDYWKNQNGTFKDNTSGEMINFNYPAKSDYAYSPKVGLVFHPVDEFRFRTSYSTGFKAPSMYYLYRSAPHGSSFDLGNPELKPEKMSFSYEAGADFYINDKLEISGTWYISEFEDFQDKIVIDASDVPDYFNPGEGVRVRQSVNIGKVRLQGIEASIRYKVNKHLTGVANYTSSQSEILKYETNEEYEGNELEDSPEYFLNIGALFNNPRLFSAGIWYRYTGKQYSDMENTPEKQVEGFGLINMDISRSIMQNKLTLSVSVSNLLDKDYYGYYYSPTLHYNGAPRSVTGKIAYKL